MKIENGILVSVSASDVVDGHFNIPSDVHTIGLGAFKGLSELKSISIPSTIKEIQSDAFSDCKMLNFVSLPSSVEKIGSNAFSGCKYLNKVKLAEGLKVIEDHAFSNCEALLNISIPDSVEKIGNHAFSMCKGLTKAKLPKFIKEIEPFTFESCVSLTGINLPETIENIGRNAFMECDELKVIKIPKKVSEIDTGTFLNCSKLQRVVLPENLLRINDGAFTDCAALRYIKLPNSLTYIGKRAFQSCRNLRGISIPSSVVTVDKNAFNECLALRNITIEYGVKNIEKAAFRGTSAKKILIPKSVKSIKDSAFADNPKLKQVEIEGEISVVGSNLFKDCYALERVKLPESVKSIESYAFAGCDNLKEINLPDGITNIDDYVFASCYLLSNITLPSTLDSLGQGVFTNCKSLRNINIPKSVEHIKSNTFSNCEFLELVTIDGDLKTIGDKAFDQCRKLREVILPKTVTVIGEDSFRNCSSLSKFFIPKSVTSMGKYNGVSFTHYIKGDDGFTFLRSQGSEIGNSMKEMRINLSILSSNWEYADMLLAEQTNPKVADFYNNLFIRLPKQQADDFLKSHNFTFYKQVAEKYNVQNQNALKFLYNIGLFNNPVDHNGKKIDYAQKVAGVMVDGNHPLLRSDKMYVFGTTMTSFGFKKEFTDFFLENVDELVREEIRSYGFVGRSYDRFEEIQKTNTNNRGRQRQLKPTVKKFREYLEENRYEGITEETRPIANTVSKFFGGQFAFDRSVAIMEEKKRQGTPDHILSVPLKEEPIKQDFDNPFSGIDEMGVKITNLSNQVILNMANIAQNEFTYEWLSKNDPENLILGKLCSCCAHIDGMGYGIMRASIVDPSVQNLVIRDKYSRIVAKATIFINEKEGYGVFNTIQVSQDLDKSYRKQIYEKYLLGVEDFINQYNKEHPERPLTQVNVGMGLNDLSSFIEENHKYADELLKSMRYSRYGGHGNYYEGDCFMDQYIIWESDGRKFVSNLIDKNKQLLLPSSESKNPDENLEKE